MKQDGDEPCQEFSTTHWSLVGRAGHGDREEQKRALNQLLRRYLPALRAHLVNRKRLSDAIADDVLQEFMLRKFVEREIIKQADPAIGRFRGFLVASLDRFVVDEYRRAHSKKRSVDFAVAIDEHLDAAEATREPHNAFDIAWAKQLLSAAIDRMREMCQRNGRADIWDVFQGRLLDPLLQEMAPVSYEELVARHGLVSPDKASNLLVTAQRMFVRALRSLIGEYERDDEMIDAEIADLRRILCGGKD